MTRAGRDWLLGAGVAVVAVGIRGLPVNAPVAGRPSGASGRVEEGSMSAGIWFIIVFGIVAVGACAVGWAQGRR